MCVCVCVCARARAPPFLCPKFHPSPDHYHCRFFAVAAYMIGLFRLWSLYVRSPTSVLITIIVFLFVFFSCKLYDRTLSIMVALCPRSHPMITIIVVFFAVTDCMIGHCRLWSLYVRSPTPVLITITVVFLLLICFVVLLVLFLDYHTNVST